MTGVTDFSKFALGGSKEFNIVVNKKNDKDKTKNRKQALEVEQIKTPRSTERNSP